MPAESESEIEDAVFLAQKYAYNNIIINCSFLTFAKKEDLVTVDVCVYIYIICVYVVCFRPKRAFSSISPSQYKTVEKITGQMTLFVFSSRGVGEVWWSLAKPHLNQHGLEE